MSTPPAPPPPAPTSQPPPPLAFASNNTPPPAPPPFQPIFTLITPTTCSTTPSAPVRPHIHPHVQYIFADDPDPPTSPPPGVRALTVELDATGTRVTSAHSLSEDFQLIGADLKEAPRIEGGREGGLMLDLIGVERGLRGVKSGGGVTELAEVFHERMAMLKRVVEFSAAEGGVESETTMPGEHVEMLQQQQALVQQQLQQVQQAQAQAQQQLGPSGTQQGQQQQQQDLAAQGLHS